MKVTIYTTQNCTYCNQSKKLFNDNSVEYSEVNVIGNPEAVNFIRETTGQMGVPVIVIDDQILVGYDEQKLKELLNIN